MREEFMDIKIEDLDDGASGPSGQGALMRMVLRLSGPAPNVWAKIFDQEWENHFSMMKRRASASGNRIEVICMPTELEKGLLEELKKIVEKANDNYRKYVALQNAQQQREADERKQMKDDLAALRGRLKFD